MRAHGAETARRVGALAPRDPGSLWAWALLCLGWSAGDPRAARHLAPFAARLATVPERERFAALVNAVIETHTSGPALSHANPAYSVLRTAQKIEGGRLMAQQTGGDPEWFGPTLPPTTQAELLRLAEGA
jgi:hypothetical protein